jgi:hypothetical protein
VQDAHPLHGERSLWCGPGLSQAGSTDLSSLVAVAGSGSPQGRPEGVASVPSFWPAPTRGSAAGRDDAHGQARTESVRSGEQWMVNPLMVHRPP